MADIGAQLREAREAQGLSLLEAERETRIRRVFLQALEEDRYADMPGDVYTRGFLRNYALYLKLDLGPLLAEFDSMRAAPHRVEPDILDEPLLVSQSSNTGARIFLLLMAIIILLMVGWYAYIRFYGGPSPADLLQRWGIGGRQTTSYTREPPVTLRPEDTPAAQNEQPTPEPSATSEPALSPTPTRTAFPTRTATAISGILVSADIYEDTWVQVTIDDGVMLEDTLLAGAHLEWQAQSVIALSIGNAGGISITVNGVTLGTLGASGAVTEVTYTLDTLPTPAP